MKNILYAAVAAALGATLLCSPCRAEGPAAANKDTQPKAAKKMTAPVAQWHIGLGYFQPRETDMSGGPSIGGGIRYHMDRDSLYVNYYYSPVQVDGLGAGVDDNMDNFVFGAGYMRGVGRDDKLRIGAGIQVHQMKISWYRGSSPGFEILGEYDFARHWTAHLQGSSSNKNGVRFGAYELRLLRDL